MAHRFFHYLFVGFCWLLVASMVAWPTSCAYFSWRGERGMDAVKAGDTRQEAARKVGIDYRSQTPRSPTDAFPFACAAPCVERLWFENRTSLMGQAWIVELDANGKVTEKYETSMQ